MKLIDLADNWRSADAGRLLAPLPIPINVVRLVCLACVIGAGCVFYWVAS